MRTVIFHISIPKHAYKETTRRAIPNGAGMTTATQETSENVKHYWLCLVTALTETHAQKSSASISLQRSIHDDGTAVTIDTATTCYESSEAARRGTKM
jgi:hypothetical protein